MAKRISAASDLAMLKWASLEHQGIGLQKRIEAYNIANESLRLDGFKYTEDRDEILAKSKERYHAIRTGEVVVVSPGLRKTLGLE